jgi:proline dehydrogenase
MLRAGLLYLSEQPAVFRFVRGNPVARRLASRFVAGETLDTAVEAVRQLNARRATATLDLLGESVRTEAEAAHAATTAIQMLDRIAAERLDSNISVKLTQLGLDISHDVCVANTRRLLDRARQLGGFVRIDMEGSAYTQRTLDLIERELYPDYPQHVGVVIQSYLYRSGADVERLIGLGMRVRLCKGAYKEPADVAYPAKADVDASYGRLMETLLERGHYPGIATHDEALIRRARAFVAARGIAPERFEFQMLYGVRRDLQEALVRDGYRMRVYVPFGTQWYPYLMRRLAERPANIAFILGNVVREGVRR